MELNKDEQPQQITFEQFQVVHTRRQTQALETIADAMAYDHQRTIELDNRHKEAMKQIDEEVRRECHECKRSMSLMEAMGWGFLLAVGLLFIAVKMRKNRITIVE